MSAACVLTFVTGTRASAVAHDLADGADVAQRIAVGAQRECHLPQLRGRDLRVRDVHDRRNTALRVRPYRAVAATPMISGSRGMLPRDLDVPPHRILLAEVGPGEEVAHHGDGQRSLPIALLDLPAPQHRNLHRREETRSRLQNAGALRRHAVDGDRVRLPALMSEACDSVACAHAGNLARGAAADRRRSQRPWPPDIRPAGHSPRTAARCRD